MCLLMMTLLQRILLRQSLQDTWLEMQKRTIKKSYSKTAIKHRYQSTLASLITHSCFLLQERLSCWVQKITGINSWSLTGEFSSLFMETFFKTHRQVFIYSSSYIEIIYQRKACSSYYKEDSPQIYSSHLGYISMENRDQMKVA